MGALWIRQLSVLAAAAVVGVTGATVAAQAAPTALNWGPVSTSSVPPTREFGAMSFDSTRNRTVLWGGGNSAFVNLNDTWEFDGATWVQRTPATSPPALVGSAMAFDANRNVSVMFGGSAPAGNSSATWEWDGTNWTLRTFATSPSARLWTTMAYDSARGKIVLFGGDGAGSTEFGDTWEYDGLTWTHMTPANSPSPRFGSAMAYDPGLGRVVLFGGRVSGQRMADTWEWDGTNWTQFTPTATPFPRFWHTMAFDSQVGHVVVFGGDHIEPFGLGPINDTWEWDGGQWTQDWTNATPSARAGQTMALDANGRIVMFGGSDEGNPGVFPTDTEELGTGIVTPAGTPALTFNPTSVEAGNHDVGVTSAATNIRVSNSGTGPLLATISTTGDFAISSTYCPSAPNPFAAGMACVVFVTFTPTASGDRFGFLVFTGNVAGGSQSVPLHGVGICCDFSISASPTNLGIVQGASTTISVSTTLIGTAGTVVLSAQPNDPGITATYNPASITAGGSSTATVSVAPTVAPGLYGMNVVGTEGPVFHFVVVHITVFAGGDFSMSANPANVSVAQALSVTSDITAALVSGRAGPINLSVSAPPGLSTALSNTVMSAGGDSILTVTASATLAPGPYTVTVTGVEGTITHSVSVTVNVTANPSDFSISANPNSVPVVQGTSGTTSIVTALVTGTTDTISLSVTAPAGLTATLSPSSVTTGGTSTLTVTASPTVTPGANSVTVTGADGATTHSVTVSVSVISANSDFSISANPNPISVVQGAGGTSTVDTTFVTGTPDLIRLSASAPAGLTASLSTTLVNAGNPATLTVTASATVAPGPYTVTVTGVENGVLGPSTHSVSVTVNITSASSDFSIGANPSSLTLMQGNAGTSTISTTLVTGTADAISLTATSAPSGLPATLNPAAVNAGGTSTLTVSPDFATAPGVYTVTVTGTEASGATHSASVTVTVTAAPTDFSISSSPTALTIVQGSSAVSSVSTVQVEGPGTVALSAASSPAGLSGTLSPTAIGAGGTSTLTVSAAYTTAPGSYTVTVTGTEGPNTHSTVVTVTVTLKGIVNGGFETGDVTGWTTTGVTAIVRTPHSGAFAAQVGSSSPSTESTLSQTFTVPAAGGKLTFWYRMSCLDKVKNDWFTATLHDGVTGTTATVQTPICSKVAAWTKVTVNVSSFAGHSVTLTLINHDDGNPGDPTYTLVDDVSLS